MNEINVASNASALTRIKKKLNNVFETIGEYYKKSLLRSISVANLKEICRNRGIKGYSKKAKSELVNFLFTSLKEKEIDKILLILSETIKEIHEFKEMEEGRIRKLIDIITRGGQLLDAKPNNIIALYYNGKAFKKLQEPQETLRYFDKIIEKYPLLEQRTKNKLYNIMDDVLTTKGEILISMKRFDEALEHLDKSLEMDKTNGFYNKLNYLEMKGEIYQELNDEEGQLKTYRKMDEHPPADLKIGTILINRGKFAESRKILENMYGCESHDTLWAPAQLQIARAAAIQNKKGEMIEYLKKAMRTTIFFMNDASHYSKRDLIEDIEHIPDFDKYRNTKEFQFVLNFEWELEDEIELVNKLDHYIKEKELNPEQQNLTNLNLIAYLCKYVESDIYLDFNLDQNGLISNSKSIMIIPNSMVDHFRGNDYKVNYAKFKFFQDKLNWINPLDPSKSSYVFNKFTYKKDDIETALKIIEGPIEALIPARPFPLILKNVKTSSPYIRSSNEYREHKRRKSYDYSILIY
ncbi:MAG: tetratricopeptide repeat protein, partial [Promethearchaeota archaeon]